MKINVEVELDLKIKEVTEKVNEAIRLGLHDTIVAIHDQTLRNARALGMWVTGNNNRSIAAEVSGMGLVATGSEGGAEHMVDDSKLEAAIYSTSGYGGYLEVGHGIIMPKKGKFLVWEDKSGNLIFAKSVKAQAGRPYFRPALDAHKNKLAPNVKRHMEKA